MTQPLWTPTPEQQQATQMYALMQRINQRHGLSLASYDELWEWSTTHIEAFWEEVWLDNQVVHSAPYTSVLQERVMPFARWFEGARLNFAENLLRYRDEQVALRFVHESGAEASVTYAELYAQTARLAATLRELGVQKGDRVAAFMPNRIETVVGMLAATSLGAVWSSCSPDFGFRGVMDRFGQIEPKILIACDGYTYGGKRFDRTERIAQVIEQIQSIEAVLIVEALGDTQALDLPKARRFADALDNGASELEFAQLPFDHPLYILYSSGTTGVPKCIVHGAGGTLLQHLKELRYHNDLRRTDTLFYFTTCGWMMWNWLVSGLAVGATLVLYDGSPASPSVDTLWKMAERHAITHFGTSPKYLSLCDKSDLTPGQSFNLSSLRVVLSTGAPLSNELFHWVYDNISEDLQLASISGGTDIVSCFMLGSPISPVYAGEIQKRGLGMRVEAWTAQDTPVVGDKAELVCAAPFPSMPVMFWNDQGGTRYTAAYFEHFPGVWRHGDFVEVTDHGGVIVYGRSDATLNPGGIRIGTAEIYRVVEAMEPVVDSLVVGQNVDDDVRVLLFVVLRDGLVLDESLTRSIKSSIRAGTTPRHVPAKVIQVPAIPRTISGKKVELAVRRAIHGEHVANRDAMANPEALDHFMNLHELKE